jgi:hypothetical protein
MGNKKDHMVQVIMGGFRYRAVEANNVIHFSRDGDPIGNARWHDDQFVHCSAVLPDEVTGALEKLVKARMDVNWE